VKELAFLGPRSNGASELMCHVFIGNQIENYCVVLMGATMSKYTTPLPCIVKVIQKYIFNLNFVKEKNHKILTKHIDLQSQAIYVDKEVFKKKLHILEEGASSVQVDILST
jgi:hypothetical protein